MSRIGDPKVADALSPDPRSTYFPNVNSFQIAGYDMPGKWTLTDATKKFGWQIQQGYGQSGAFIFPKGDELVVAKFKGELWRDIDVRFFKSIRRVLLVKPTVQTTGQLSVSALGIDHPELTALGVLAVVVGEIGPLVDSGAGLWTCKIDLLQYRAPQPVKAPPEQIVSAATRNPPITALSASEVTAQRLAAEVAIRGAQ